MKTATINMRVREDVKANSEMIFSSLGMTLTEAINIFLHKSIMEGGLPFDVRQSRYNAETEAVIRESRDIISGKIIGDRYATVDDMFTALGLNSDATSGLESDSNSKCGRERTVCGSKKANC